MYAVYTFGDLSGPVPPKVPRYVFVTLVGEGIDRGISQLCGLLHVRPSFDACLPLTPPRAEGYCCGVRYALQIFTKGLKWHIPSKQQRSALPNGKSIRSNQVQNFGGDQGAGQTVILKSLSVFQSSIASTLPRRRSRQTWAGKKKQKAWPSVEPSGPRTPTTKAS